MSVILFLNFVLSTNNEGYKYKKAAKGDYDYDYDEDAETVVYDFEEDESKACYTYFDESEIFNCVSYDKYIKTKEEQTSSNSETKTINISENSSENSTSSNDSTKKITL